MEEIELYKKYILSVIDFYKITNQENFRKEFALLVKACPKNSTEEKINIWNQEKQKIILKYSTLTEKEINEKIIRKINELRSS